MRLKKIYNKKEQKVIKLLNSHKKGLLISEIAAKIYNRNIEGEFEPKYANVITASIIRNLKWKMTVSGEKSQLNERYIKQKGKHYTLEKV